jgi:hypothetical protein
MPSVTDVIATKMIRCPMPVKYVPLPGFEKTNKNTVIYIPSRTVHGEYVADVTGVMIMLLVAQDFRQTRAKSDEKMININDTQIEPYDVFVEAWRMCRDEPLPKEKWFDDAQIRELVLRARRVIESFGVISRISFEVPIKISQLYGRVDCLVEYSDGTLIVFEFKCVILIMLSHIRQLTSYLSIVRCNYPNKKRIRAILFNLFNNEGMEIFQPQ